MDISALKKLSYGLYVIGVKNGNGFGGCVVDSLAQVNMASPPVIFLSCQKRNYTRELIQASREFTLSVLPEDADPFVVANFGFQSARNTDKWANVSRFEYFGLPVLECAAAKIFCRVYEEKDLDTHTGFFCEAVGAEILREAKPLIYGDYVNGPMKDEAMTKFKEFKLKSERQNSDK